MKLKIKLFCLLFFLKLITHAQDVHFSQFNGSLLNLSPGYTGMFNGDYRFGAIYRSQWASVPVSYSSFSMNGEGRFKPNLDKTDVVGYGLVFNSDKAGAANYGSNQIYLSGNYIHYINPDSSMVITGGLNLGFCNVGFDFTKMTFDNQFDGLEFNNTLPTGEKFGRTARNYFDINAGSVFQYTDKKFNRITYAVGLHHLSRPKISYQGNDVSTIYVKMNNCLSFTHPMDEKKDFIAEALFTFQGKYYEVIPHLGLKYYLNKEENKSIMVGMLWRARDAYILRTGYGHQNFNAGISYDINYSKFTAASNYRGAFEIFINHVIKNKVFKPIHKRYCTSNI
jgi:type IX secretion system PorP/SprF family membrane protein